MNSDMSDVTGVYTSRLPAVEKMMFCPTVSNHGSRVTKDTPVALTW